MSQISSITDSMSLPGLHIVRSRPISEMNLIQLKSWAYLSQIARLMLDDDWDATGNASDDAISNASRYDVWRAYGNDA